MVILIIGLCEEKLYSLDSSSDLVSNSSIKRCVVNGRSAMAARS